MNIYTLILIVAGLIWLVAVFFGYRAGLQKSFQNNPNSSINSEAVQDKQDQFIEETQRKQKEKMDQIKQRLEDQRRRER